VRFDSPEAIRAALLPEQIGDFEAALLAGGPDVLRCWRRIALMTEPDPAGQRQLFATVDEIRRTGRPRPGSMSWEEVKAALGL
jgi:hypothetical protein